MAVVESCACPHHFCTRLSGTPAVTAATPHPWRKPFGLACGPLTPARAMTSHTRRHPVIRLQDHRRWLRPRSARPWRGRRPWTRSSISTSVCGTGTTRYTPDRRFFKVSKTTRSARRSTRSAVSHRASDKRQPVWASSPHSVRTSRDASSAAVTKAARSAVVRYLRCPLASYNPSSIRCRVGIRPPYAVVVVLPASGLTTPRARCTLPCAHAAVAMGGGDTECTQGYEQRCGVAQGCLLHGFVPQYGLHSGAGDASHSAGGHRVVCRSLRRLVRSSEPHGGCLTYGTFCQ